MKPVSFEQMRVMTPMISLSASVNMSEGSAITRSPSCLCTVSTRFWRSFPGWYFTSLIGGCLLRNSCRLLADGPQRSCLVTARSSSGEQPVELGEVDVGDALITPDNDHILIIGVGRRIAEIADPVTTIGSSRADLSARTSNGRNSRALFSFKSPHLFLASTGKQIFEIRPPRGTHCSRR